MIRQLVNFRGIVNSGSSDAAEPDHLWQKEELRL